MQYVPGTRQIERVVPVCADRADRGATRGVHLPYPVGAVGMSGGTREDAPVIVFANVVSRRVAVGRIEIDWVVLVERFAIDHWLGRRARVIGGDGFPDLHVRVVAGLQHVEVEPGIVVEPRARRLASRRMPGHQVAVAIAGLDTGAHRLPDRHGGGVGMAVTAQDSDQIRTVGVALRQPLPVGVRASLAREDHPFGAEGRDFVAPRRQ